MNTESAAVLELINVCKTYPRVPGEEDFTGRKTTLAGISINVKQGEIYGFVGLNGAGKTTGIKIALGLTNPDSGDIKWFGEPLSAKVFQRIGYSPEKPSFYEFLTAEEILDFGGRLLHAKPSQERKQEVLTLVGLWGNQNKKVSAYSKGMQQRLALASAMIHDPDVLILDEPSSGLDPLGRRMIKNLLTDLKKAGKTIFFSTHILADVSEICDRVGVIHEGKMIYEGPLKEFNPQQEDLEKRFVELISTRS